MFYPWCAALQQLSLSAIDQVLEVSDNVAITP